MKLLCGWFSFVVYRITWNNIPHHLSSLHCQTNFSSFLFSQIVVVAVTGNSEMEHREKARKKWLQNKYNWFDQNHVIKKFNFFDIFFVVVVVVVEIFVYCIELFVYFWSISPVNNVIRCSLTKKKSSLFKCNNSRIPWLPNYNIHIKMAPCWKENCISCHCHCHCHTLFSSDCKMLFIFVPSNAQVLPHESTVFRNCFSFVGRLIGRAVERSNESIFQIHYNDFLISAIVWTPNIEFSSSGNRKIVFNVIVPIKKRERRTKMANTNKSRKNKADGRIKNWRSFVILFEMLYFCNSNRRI